MEYAREGKLLGLRMTTHGFSRQVTHNRNRAGATLGKLRRFSAFRSRIKLHLYKTLVRPLLEYPAVPLHVAKPTPLQKLQAVQNRALRWVHGWKYDPDRPELRLSAVALHQRYRVEPLNLRLWRLARRTWERLLEDNDLMLWRIDFLADGVPEGARDHAWWPRSRAHALGPPPRPICVRADVLARR